VRRSSARPGRSRLLARVERGWSVGDSCLTIVKESRASLTVLVFALLLVATPMGCGPKQRCEKKYLFVDYSNGQPDTVYATLCTPVSAR